MLDILKTQATPLHENTIFDKLLPFGSLQIPKNWKKQFLQKMLNQQKNNFYYEKNGIAIQILEK